MNTLIVSLNIGTTGFFRHYVPQQVSKYYEKAFDLDSNTEVSGARSPALRIAWPPAHLSEDLLLRSLLCLQMMPGPRKEKETEPYDHYLAGLAFLGMTDVHLQFESNAYDAFVAALRSGMLLHGEHEVADRFDDSFRRVTKLFLPSQAEQEKHVALMATKPEPSGSRRSKTLREAFELKLICDAYFLQKFHDRAVAEKDERAEGGITDEA